MELPTQEQDMPLPLNTSYGGGHIIHHHPHEPTPPHIPSNGPTVLLHHDHQQSFKKIVKYRECLKNHAAAMGGNATDGCGEFMPSGEDGTIEALTCSACNCHRNFHRKEVEGSELQAPQHQVAANTTTTYDGFYHHHHHNVNARMGSRKVFVGHHHHHHKGGYLGGPEGVGYHHAAGALRGAVPPAAHQMIMSYSQMGSQLPSESDEEGGGVGVRVVPSHLVKKRFRTKFTQEQKEKMLEFAERVGWKIQKQEEGVVQQFCQEVGVKRRVLKVWMHNNKHSLGKIKNNNNNNSSSSNHHDDVHDHVHNQAINVVVGGGGENQD